MHPEDADIDENELVSVTLSNILATGLHNDLGIFVRQKIIILIEAQSTWSENILWRIFYYLAESYRRIWTENKLNIYGSKKVYLPIPELYVIYIGEKQLNKEIISLKEEFFDNKETPLDLKVKIISLNKMNNDTILYTNINENIEVHANNTIDENINQKFNKNSNQKFLPKH